MHLRVAPTCPCALIAGSSMYGSLGNDADPLKQAISDTPVAVVGNHTFHTISCGWGHTCALDEESRAWCWGKCNQRAINALTRFSAVCVMAGYLDLRRMFVRRSTGFNTEKQLGSGGTKHSSVPLEVEGERAYTAICASRGHTCAIEVGGRTLCWGALLCSWQHGSFMRRLLSNACSLLSNYYCHSL